MADLFLDWDPARVAQYFLLELGEDAQSSFISHNIDGSLLPFLTTGHLHELAIEPLATRLRVKKKLNELLASQYTDSVAKASPADMHLRAIDINSNYVSIEALELCLALLRDLSTSSRRLSDDTLDLKKLNENFKKLRLDLYPVMRLAKDSKPLPTPTLDPGAVGASAHLPTQSIHSVLSTSSWLPVDSDGGHTPTTATTLVLPASSPSKLGLSPQTPGLSPGFAPSPTTHMAHSAGPAQSHTALVLRSASTASAKMRTTSPTQSHRFSSGSLLSVGVGKVSEMMTGLTSRFPSKPRLVDAKSSSFEDVHDASTLKTPMQPTHSLGLNPGSTPGSALGSTLGSRPIATRNKPSSSLVTSGTPPAPTPNSLGLANQPLKQLKASSDDTCLKVLQHAMKRHHIPREKWSKYVLVVCYGDKERILKLTEKPVLIFKELQEHGQNPTIMLRERASSSENERDYADARIGADIPGGVL